MRPPAYRPEKRTGIWIDLERAYIFKVSADKPPVIEQLESGIKSRERIPGEQKPFTKFEQMPFNRQEKQQRRQHNQQRQFFKTIFSRLRDEDYLYIFGPGEAKNLLEKAIEKEGGRFPCKVVALETTDQLTQNQMLQKVKTYFSSLAYEDSKRKLEMQQE